ncbi:MAG TPA: hypothetical protein VFS91_04180 [Nitrobacter sp.]|nr:hypothetical protein [Nitrobacter sp.]
MAREVTDVSRLVAMFEESEEASHDARRLAERDRDYYDNKQWTSAEEATIKGRGQPVTTHNAIQRKVDYLSGLERQTRRDPKAFPRTPGDEGSAQAATDALRYATENADWDGVRSAAWDNLIVEGECAVMVGAKDSRQGIDPELIHIRWDRFFADPHAAKADFSDAAYMGFITWDDVENAKALFPGRDDVLETTLADSSRFDTYDDKPKWRLWADHKRKRVRYAEIYYRRGQVWYRCVFTKAGHLTDPEPSPYLDENGQPENPIKAVCLRRDRDNNTYGDVRIMISPQDGLNKSISKAIHTFTMRQSRVSRGAGVAPDMVKKELAKPDGSIVADKDEFEVLPTNDIGAAALNMMNISRGFIDGLGANASLQGKQEQDLSGRALLAQQQGGMIEIARAMDRLRMLSLAVYRSTWFRIRQFWTGERWVRVTDDERSPRFVGLNRPVTMLEEAQARLAPMMQDPERRPQAELQLGLLSRDPMAQQPIRIENPVAELDVDIVIDEGMDTPTVQAEQFDTLTKIMPGIVNLPPPMMKLLVMASSLRDKDKLLQELEQMTQQPQIPPELQQQIQEGMQLLQQQAAQIEELQRAVSDKQGDLAVKAAQVGVQADQQQTDEYRAVSERIQALTPDHAPQ